MTQKGISIPPASFIPESDKSSTRMSDKILLICWVYGDMNPFSVEISRQKIVDQLKQAIVAKKPNRFHGIDAESLTLWKVEIPDDDDAVKQNFEFKGSDILRPSSEIGDYFEGYPPKRRIHIIIRAPEPGK